MCIKSSNKCCYFKKKTTLKITQTGVCWFSFEIKICSPKSRQIQVLVLESTNQGLVKLGNFLKMTHASKVVKSDFKNNILK